MNENMSNNNPFYNIYNIKKGDNLYEISKEFNVNTKLLAEINGLELDDYIYPGQTILIPKKNVSYYITKDGDTLKEIGNIFDLSVEQILNQNKTIYLLPGQIIYYKRS